jgi:DegV family protein with EDD domain
MNKVAITTDSTCVPLELARKSGITIIPYYLAIDGKGYSDLEAPREEIYNRLMGRENLPTSAIPSLGEFLQTWQKLSQGAEAILHIALTSSFSGAYNTAIQAKQMAHEKLPETDIEIIDSRSVGAGQLLITLEAAKAAAQGKNLRDVTEVAANMMPRVTLLTARDTLFYFDKAGLMHEAPRARSWAEAETASSFRSILETDASTGGVPKPVARAKTKTQIMGKLVEIVEEKVGAKKLHAAIQHINVPEQAEQLRNMLMHQLQCEEIHVYEGSVVAAINNGLGLLELGFYGN